MESPHINLWAILVAAAVYMMLGALWYSPALFGRLWCSLIGKTQEQLAGEFSPVNYLLAYCSSFLAAYGIARIMIWTGHNSVLDGIIISLLVGLCFVLSTMGVNDLFERRPIALTSINLLYHLVGFVMIGVVISVWP